MKQKRKEALTVWQVLHGKAGSPGQGKTTDESVIALVLKGSMFVTVDSHRHTIFSGEMFLLASGYSYEYRIQENVRIVACRFLPEILAENLPVGNLVCQHRNTVNGLSVLNISSPCYHFLRLLEYYREMGIDGQRMQVVKRKEFFCLLLNTYNKVELAGFLRPVMDEKSGFRSFITGNWKKARNVEELAAMANLSTSGFMKKFKKCFNESPYRWMLRRKAECVRVEIVSGRLPLKEIAEKYHFASYSHFCTFCKLQYGVLPKGLLNGKNEIE